MSIHTLCYLALDTIKGASADEQYVTGINMNVFLVGMLTTALRGHVDIGTFKQFQQSLLNALATDIASD